MSEPLTRVPRLVVFSATEPMFAMRVARRAQLLAMLPVDPTETASAPPPRSASDESGAYWEYLQVDDRPLFIRARDLDDEDDARRDAHAVFTSSAVLSPVFVRDPRSGALAWWLVHDRRVVLVPPRVWLPTQRLTLTRHLRSARRALRAQPPWGVYTP